MCSQKKDYEVALVGAFRREKDKDIALQALTAENQAAVQLVCLKNCLILDFLMDLLLLITRNI